MRLRNIPGAREKMTDSPFVSTWEELQEQLRLTDAPIDWQEKFVSPHPLYVEIGTGKGKFLLSMARRYPERNFLGIEKYSSVLLRAVQKLEKEETETKNLHFLRMDAEEVSRIFSPESVSGIYLNFSDPWPKERYAKRRLPSAHFLEKFEWMLIEGGRLEFKTDNQDLFHFALEEVEKRKTHWAILAYDTDFQRNSLLAQDNLPTEYEEKFSGQGKPIAKYILERRER